LHDGALAGANSEVRFQSVGSLSIFTIVGSKRELHTLSGSQLISERKCVIRIVGIFLSQQEPG